MAKFEMLNNITHKDLRVIAERSEVYGDLVGGCLIFPAEFVDVQREYPIFFQKDPSTGEFQAITIFGFSENENLFLQGKTWNASYIPALLEREPFLIGLQQKPGEAEPELVVNIDMDSPRISKTHEGELLFLDFGGNSAYLNKITKILKLMHEGVTESKDMFTAFLALDIIEPMVLNIEFNNGEKYQSSAYYTINQEKFFSLPDNALVGLHRSGFMHYAYMAISSLGNIKKLIKMRSNCA